MIRKQLMTNAQLEECLAEFEGVIFENAKKNPPHPLIQSYFIILWTNINIHFAMNYVLSAYCTAFDEVAVVTLLKRLTVFSGADGIYVSIIKAIWEALFHHDALRDAVLSYESRNVASFSLSTLATHYNKLEGPSLDTFVRIFVSALKANQQITLETYSCIARRLGNITSVDTNQQHVIGIALDVIWSKVMPLLKGALSHRKRRGWVICMVKISDTLKLVTLSEKVRLYAAVNLIIF